MYGNQSTSFRSFYQQSDVLVRLILINIAVFVAVIIVDIIGALSGFSISKYFISLTALPTDGLKLITRPWTFVTYMFLHEGFMHILFNMLWLYFGGMLFREFLGSRRLLGVYLWGGLVGGFLYVLVYNLSPAFKDVVGIANARGASASVMAIVVAIATYRPKFPVQLFFVLRVPLWGIAVFAVLMDLLALRGLDSNPGGHLAHLGGALFGFFYIRSLRAGNDLSEGIMNAVDWIQDKFSGKPQPVMRTVYRNKSSAEASSAMRQANSKQSDQQRMDEILDKISRSGYNSLSKDEKDFLFKLSKNDS
ncbi:MAG: rhomboid family intramembrane serine protease [Flavobacteriales bacterium]|nr:MAG: rhomboid family intramembrane serine protease [Flavobacteriales bacterium]